MNPKLRRLSTTPRSSLDKGEYQWSICYPSLIRFVRPLRSLHQTMRISTFCKDLHNNTSYSQKHSTLPLAALLLRRIPLDLPFCRSSGVRGMLQCPSDLPLSLYPEHALPYTVIDLRELAASHF